MVSRFHASQLVGEKQRLVLGDCLAELSCFAGSSRLAFERA